MLCIAMLYRNAEANVTVLSCLSTVFHVILFTGHEDTVGSEKPESESRHNIDHAVQKTDYSDLCA